MLWSTSSNNISSQSICQLTNERVKLWQKQSQPQQEHSNVLHPATNSLYKLHLWQQMMEAQGRAGLFRKNLSCKLGVVRISLLVTMGTIHPLDLCQMFLQLVLIAVQIFYEEERKKHEQEQILILFLADFSPQRYFCTHQGLSQLCQHFKMTSKPFVKPEVYALAEK